MIRIVSSLVFLFAFIQCSVAQPGRYGTEDKKAVKYYEAARVCYGQVDPYTGLRNLSCAEENLTKALERDPNFIEAHILLSNVYIDRHDFGKAIAQKEKMFATGKKVSESEYFYMASMNMAVGAYEKCLKYANYYLQVKNANQNMVNKCYKYVDDCTFALQAIKNPVPFEPKNLGPNVNSDRPEYFPSITADDHTLLYTRLVLDNNALNGVGKQEDIFVAETPEPDHWTYGTPISENINTIYNEGAPTFSADGKYVILVGCETGMKGEYDYGNDRKGYGSCDLFVSEKIGAEWTKPVNLGTPINSSHFESQPCFSSDGKTLYFIRGFIEKGSLRDTKNQDIYKCEITPEGWSKPERLPDYINTPYREESVQIHPDGQTLYFSSEGHTGMGGLDIYMCRMQADGKWGKPVNLGYPINTFMDENSLLVSSKGNLAYFASNREGGYGDLDLYQFNLPKKFQPIKTTFMKGVVYDSITKKPLAADFQLIDLSTGITFKRAIANSGNGEFIVALPVNKNFALIAEHEGYFFYSKNYSLDKLEHNEEGFLVNVPMQPIGKTTFVLENIFFDVDKWDLKSESVTELNKLKALLEKNPSLKIELGGHTDSDGDDKHNLTLSDNRAKAVKQWLIDKGIAAERLSHKGYGETKPIAPNDSAENKAKNRRTEVRIL